MEQEVIEHINNLQKAYEEEKHRNSQMQKQYASTMFTKEENENLIKWQLDIKEELERIEHLLRGHVPKRDIEGNEYWDESKEDMLFNEKGIREILKLMAWYLNKNFILSNFSEDQVNARCEEFGYTLIDFIYNNYDIFGWDDVEKDKIKHYQMLVMNLINTIEAVYNRALNGGERDSLRTARNVLQTEPLTPNNPYPMPQKNFSLLKPTTWIGR